MTERPEWNPMLIEAYKRVRLAANAYDDEFNAAVSKQVEDLPSAHIHATVRDLPEVRNLWEDYQLALEQYHWTQIYLSQHHALTVPPKDPKDQSPAPTESE